MPVDVFISYAIEDKAHLQSLEAHLALLRRQGILRAWHAELVVPGQDWDAEATRRLALARMIILLVSADYFFSDVSYTQMERAIERSRQGKACVIPVLLRPCLRQGSQLEGLSKLPDDGVPISGWPDRDAAWENVASGIRRAIVEVGRGETISPMTAYPDQILPHRISTGRATAKPVRTNSTSRTTIEPPSIAPHVRSSTLMPKSMVDTRNNVVGTSQYRTLMLSGAALASVAVLSPIVWYCVRSTMPETVEQPGTHAEQLGQPERGWIEAYGAAIDSRDVNQILALHVIPTSRFFAARNLDEEQLRKLYQGWFDGTGRIHRTGFDGCSLANVTSNGSRALRCDTYVDPPFTDKKLSRVAACLVFTKEGKLVSRTEISQIPDCPPRL